MSHSFPLQRWTVSELDIADASQWRTRVAARLQDGERLVTAYARRNGDDAIATAVFQSADHGLEALRGRIDRARGYDALTADFPAMHCFEREMHEQAGVHLPGHPWLKPVRFEGAAPDAVMSYPFYRITGKEVHEVQVGPIHAGIIEPGAFRFMCLGETVHHLEIQLGYQHRGVETLLLRGDPRTHTQLAETIAGDSSIAHAWAYCAAIESLAGIEMEIPVQRSRAIGLELERVAMHLAGLAGMAADVGFLQGAATYGRLRTTAINTTMRLCGSRFGRGWMRPGASRAVADPATVDSVRASLALLTTDLAVINDRFTTSASVQHRLRGAGTVTAEAARELGMVGMAARASGVAWDQRGAGRGIYAERPIEMCVDPAGDCRARARVRIGEIDRALEWLTQAFDPGGVFARSQHPVGTLAPSQLVVALCEGWRGEIVHCVETDADGRVVHYKVQDPSFRNWFGLALAVRGNEISDFPICNKSFDLSYCGHDL